MLNNNQPSSDVSAAVRQLQAGGLVAFPTETVYGLGADARNPEAIHKVFATKGRPADHPLIVHIANSSQLQDWATEIPARAWQLAQQFWPGPLTMVLRKQPWVSDVITGGQDTIAIRIPNHPLTLELLRQFGSGIVGPSANKYGRVSPTTAQHVQIDLGAADVFVLDGGDCQIGIESTIIDLTTDTTIVRRTGSITAQQLNAVATTGKQHLSRTSGTHAAHYAPQTPVKLIDSADLLTVVKKYQEEQSKFSVLSFQPCPENFDTRCFWQQIRQDQTLYAHDLYANLRKHDQLQNSVILVERPPLTWIAILDRLTRASN